MTNLPQLPIKILNQSCTYLGVDTQAPNYRAKPYSLSFEVGVECEKLEPNHWEVSIELELFAKHVENPENYNFNLEGRWIAVVYTEIEKIPDLTIEQVRQYLANTVGAYIWGSARNMVSTTLQGFGYIDVLLPPVESQLFVNKLVESDQNRVQQENLLGVSE